MKKQTFARTVSILILMGTMNWLSAAGGVIGMAVADGSFHLDQALVTGTGTLFEGSRIETLTAPSQLRVNQGAQFRMGAVARASVYERKLVLESGSGQLEASPGYEVEAGTLRLAVDQPGTIARIAMRDAHHLTVAAFRGAVLVTNAAGMLVARVEAGTSLDFEPPAAGAEAPTQASGCLLAKAGKFVMAEQTTSLVLELRGAGLDQELGNRVQIAGRAMRASGSSGQVIEVVSIRRLSKGGCTAEAKKLGAAAGTAAAGAATSAAGTASAGGATAAGAATATGVGAGTVATIGGVAAAATVGGLAAVGSLPGQSDTPPSASR